MGARLAVSADGARIPILAPVLVVSWQGHWAGGSAGGYGTVPVGSAGGTVPGVVVMAGTVPGGSSSSSTPSQWLARWFRTKGERYRYLDPSFPVSQ